MFTKKNSEPNALQLAIDELYIELGCYTGNSREYAAIVSQLTALHAIKDQTSEKRVSAETVALIAGNLTGILMILGHERANVVTSKALSFVMKLR